MKKTFKQKVEFYKTIFARSLSQVEMQINLKYFETKKVANRDFLNCDAQITALKELLA